MSKKTFFLLIPIVVSLNLSVKAQHYVQLQPMLVTQVYPVSSVTGVPFRETGTSNEFLGSIYLFDDWRPASAVVNSGIAYEVSKLKFDELHNKFLFNRNDTVYEFGDDVRQVKFKTPDGQEIVFEKVINANNKIPANIFVQVLSSGKITLLKHYQKTIEGENATNGMFSSTKQVVSHNNYWATVNNQTIPIKLNKRSLEEITSDKNDQINSYIKSQKLNVKEEKDFTAAIDYYNQISALKNK